jgi:hypothetical protein
MFRLFIALLVGFVIPDVQSVHAALPNSVRIELHLAPSSEDCPNTEALVSSVRNRLGYDPFGARKGRLFRVMVERSTQGYTATVEQFDATGGHIGDRTIKSESHLCSDVFEAVALSLALAAGPETPRVWGPRPRTSEAATRLTRLGISLPFFLDRSELREEGTPMRTSWYGTLLSTLGSTPGPNVALRVGARLQWNALSMEFDVQAEPPLPVLVEATTLSVARLLAGLSACLRPGTVGACVRIEGGLVMAQGKPLDEAVMGFSPALSVGLATDWRFFEVKNNYLALKLSVATPIFKTALHVGDNPLWVSPSLSGSIGMGGGMNF